MSFSFVGKLLFEEKNQLFRAFLTQTDQTDLSPHLFHTSELFHTSVLKSIDLNDRTFQNVLPL